MIEEAHSAIHALLEEAVRDRICPGAAWAVVFGGSREPVSGCMGRFTYEESSPLVDESTRWDLASLTKVIATTTVAMLLHEEGALDLDEPVRRVLPEFEGAGKDGVTFRDLLLHRSGLPPHRNFWEAAGQLTDEPESDAAILEARWEAVLREPLEAPNRARTAYSCVGFLVLQRALLALTAERYEDAWTWPFFRRIQPLGLELQFNPSDRTRCAPTEGGLQGVVHDENCRSLGGMTGNAGLFGTIGDVAGFVRALMQGVIVRHATLEAWSRRADDSSSRALGWDTKSPVGSSAGDRFGPRSFGHTGFTGTSVWIDPDVDRAAILLTNRVYPSRSQSTLELLRPRFCNMVATDLV